MPEVYNIGRHSRKISLHGKVKNIAGKSKLSFLLIFVPISEPLNINTKQNIPGPGTYGQGIEINKTGKYMLSTIENSKAAAWSPSKKRFNDDNRLTRDLPAPNHYNPSDKSQGQYLLSNFKTYGVRVFKQKCSTRKSSVSN